MCILLLTVFFDCNSMLWIYFCTLSLILHDFASLLVKLKSTLKQILDTLKMKNIDGELILWGQWAVYFSCQFLIANIVYTTWYMIFWIMAIIPFPWSYTNYRWIEFLHFIEPIRSGVSIKCSLLKGRDHTLSLIGDSLWWNWNLPNLWL